MTNIKLFVPEDKPTKKEKNQIINFLFENLQEYGDPKPAIENAVNYALKTIPSFGGTILVSYAKEKISGVAVLNQTGMKNYIPENILVYIATDKNKRAQGIGKKLLQKTLDITQGNIALHVEPHNPAKYLYKKLGFEKKYIEMRYIKS